MDRSELEIPNPCSVERDDTRPLAATRRFCASCQHEVHDISLMSEAAARALLARDERVCVRYLVTEDGEIAFGLPVIPSVRLGRRERRRRPELDAVIRLAAAASLAAMLAACTPHGEDEPNSPSDPVVSTEREPHEPVPEPMPCDPALADDHDKAAPQHNRRRVRKQIVEEYAGVPADD